MMTLQRKKSGVTLLEVLLVLAIASSLLILMLNYTTQKGDALRRDKTVLQIQQLLTSSMSFYLNNSFWPLVGASATTTKCGTWTAITALQPNYIPSNLMSPYGTTYSLGCNTAANGGGFYVAVPITNSANGAANAAIIAGRLPMAYRTTALSATPPTPCTSGTNCTIVVANVSIPGQNLNNARSVNFAGVYYSGSCVPAPTCPLNMKPEILVMPGSIAGANDKPTCTRTMVPGSCRNPPSCDDADWINTCTGKVNPLTSFTAYALGGDSSGNPVVTSQGPYMCNQMTRALSCYKSPNNPIPFSDTTKYWRVCLNVSTNQGVATPQYYYDVEHGKMIGSIIAITRCVPNAGDEQPSGSVDLWQQT